jgi:uncharacterized protein YdeI (BOF family)
MKKFKNYVSVMALTAIIGAASVTGVKASDVVMTANQASLDHTDITITGKVVAREGQNFMLDYGNGQIVVEMDDWDSFNEANMINIGEIVTVRGEIDADFYERRSIEASNVYVFNRSTYYFANDADEEDRMYWGYQQPAQQPNAGYADGTLFGMSGTVTNINGSEFTLNNGVRSMQIETSYLAYNPLDSEGAQQIKIGDRVYVAGKLDKNFFNESEIEATSVVTLARGARTASTY